MRTAHRRLALSLAPVRIRIGRCMKGLFKKGDEAELDPCPWSELKAGDLVALETPQGPVLHRFLAVRKGRMITKGDRAPFDRALPPEALLGRVTAILRGGRRLTRPRGLPLREIPRVAAGIARGIAFRLAPLLLLALPLEADAKLKARPDVRKAAKGIARLKKAAEELERASAAP